jgi:hypothetical protein
MLKVRGVDGGERQTPIGKMERVYFARELSGGRIVLAGTAENEWSMILVDYAHGSVVRREPNVHATSFGYQQWYGSDPRRTVADPEQPIAVIDGSKTLYAWQPLTGAKKKLLQF